MRGGEQVPGAQEVRLEESDAEHQQDQHADDAGLVGDRAARPAPVGGAAVFVRRRRGGRGLWN
ncbi:hypothetical protein ACTIVE_9080 [Actinomadura verrucosospora]|uniref:Uncharacterized protein n=1 Tax=Actinomadura verrucosospora TaxID=46165 RepID=A0A7D4AC47_ACTVE|nr:hypothetical protein ACTIVE_9080 [Actinomadura verrucosospora]